MKSNIHMYNNKREKSEIQSKAQSCTHDECEYKHKTNMATVNMCKQNAKKSDPGRDSRRMECEMGG